jgi:ATP/maltotriose-dependent transcriptional regulator MalT
MMSTPELESLPLIQTKLHRPLVPVDLIPRPRLLEWMSASLGQSNGFDLKPTLISALAGYGKTNPALPVVGGCIPVRAPG